MNTIELIDRLEQDKSLQKEEWIHVIEDDSEENRKYAAEKARALGDTYYGKEIFVRGLIEFTNYCKNDCYYCGIRCSNKKANRYRLSEEDILRTIALFRYINPDANIRLAAGRALLTNDGEIAFKSGASATITGNMLTTVACATIRSDRQMLTDLGRDVTPDYWKEA